MTGRAFRALALASLVLAGPTSEPSAAKGPPRFAIPEFSTLGDSLFGWWASSLPVHRAVHVRGGSDGAIVVATPGLFEATCHADGGSLVGLARLAPGVSGGHEDWARFQLLRLDWADRQNMHATFTSPATGRVITRERWTYAGGWLTHRPSFVDSLPTPGQAVSVDQEAEPAFRVPPRWPDLDARGLQGLVVVLALVGRDGLVKETFVASSVPMLDEAAVACVRQWRFKPALRSGSPVATWVTVPVKYESH